MLIDSETKFRIEVETPVAIADKLARDLPDNYVNGYFQGIFAIIFKVGFTREEVNKIIEKAYEIAAEWKRDGYP